MEQNLSQYKIFYEVAKAGNISRAAKELYISQPAISKAIGKLEDSLGLSLFTRSSRGVQLTAEGEILYQHTRDAFEALERGGTGAAPYPGIRYRPSADRRQHHAVQICPSSIFKNLY